jgi:hypothetical protein
MQAALKASFNVRLRNVVSAKFDAQRNTVHSQFSARQSDVENLNLVTLCFALGQKQCESTT